MRSAEGSICDAAVGEQLGDQLGVVQHLVVAAELRVLVAQRVQGVRIAGDDARGADLGERGDEGARQLLEQHLVADAGASARRPRADAPDALAGRAFARAEDAEAHAAPAQDLDEGAGDALAARIEGHRRADVEEQVEARQVGGRAHDGHVEALRPVAARIGLQAPRVALRLVGLEQLLQLVRELAFDHHLVLAHAEELVEMLELDRAGRLAVAAGGAGPERLGADHAAHERGQLAARVGDDRLALLEQMALEAVVDALQRQRLAGEVGRAGVLAAAAFGAGEGIEPVLPGEVARAAHAGLHVGLVGRLHQLLDVDRRHAVARSTAPEVQGRQRRDDVEVLADRQQHEEGEHDDHLRPVGEHVARLQRRRAQRGERRGERAADEGVGALVGDRREALGEEREPEAVEQRSRSP